MKLMENQVKDQVWDLVTNRSLVLISGQVWNQVDDYIWIQIQLQIQNQVKDLICSEVYNLIWDKLDTNPTSMFGFEFGNVLMI